MIGVSSQTYSPPLQSGQVTHQRPWLMKARIGGPAAMSVVGGMVTAQRDAFMRIGPATISLSAE